MWAAFTELKQAEKVKKFLIKNGLLNWDYLPVKELSHLYFPLKLSVLNPKNTVKTANLKVPGAEIVNTKFSFQKKEVPLTIDALLKGKLTSAELRLIPRSQEVVGKILILEIPEQLKKKEKIIADAYLKINPKIETVVKKSQAHTGLYRLRKVKILSGKKTKETVHFENGIQLRLNLEETYFSARSSNERLRIAKLVKKGENVLVMFSGIAPYVLVIAKNSEAKQIYGIEINPLAHKYALENVSLNNFNKAKFSHQSRDTIQNKKLNESSERIKLYSGDVRKIVPKLKLMFDRIIMPLPKTGEEFLDVAFMKAKKGSIIHLYAFLNENDLHSYERKIKEISLEQKHPLKILNIVKCGQFSPGIFRICFDLKLI